MKKNYDKGLVYWLILGAVLVAAMVVIGGITRLTDSGLSMVDWNLFSGAIPPTSEVEWQSTFDQYKNYPEYQKVNFNMTLDEFKSIFFWEWFHRVLGRAIGIIFIVPFTFFLVKNRIDEKLLPKLIVLLFLGGFQGFLGWFMVKSGLVDRPDVSHYRLAIHLCAAFLTCSYILWLIFEQVVEVKKETPKSLLRQMRWFIPLLVLQIVFGAFVAGLDAGMYFPSFPKMGEFWIPPSVGIDMETMGVASLFDRPVSVQLVHRILAYIVFIGAVVIWLRHRKSSQPKVNMGVNLLLTMVTVQATLGILTLLYHVPISLGILHQFGALILLGITVFLLYISTRKLSV